MKTRIVVAGIGLVGVLVLHRLGVGGTLVTVVRVGFMPAGGLMAFIGLRRSTDVPV